MKYMKMLGLLAVAAAAMMAFAGVASADQATSGGSTYTGEIKAKNKLNHVSLHGSNGVTIECQSTVHGNLTGHGKGKPVSGSITTLDFTGCTNGYEVHTKENGTLSAEAIGGGNATLTSSGAKVEATAQSIFGTITCVYTTNKTHIGEVTGGTNAVLDISATIPRTGGSSFCGSTGTWTGEYEVTAPADLTFDVT